MIQSYRINHAATAVRPAAIATAVRQPLQAAARSVPQTAPVLHVWVLLYLIVIYIRPGEIFPSLAQMPILDYLSMGALAAAALSLFMNRRRFWDQPHDWFFLVFTGLILISKPVWGWMGGLLDSLTRFGPVVFFYFLIRLGVQSDREIVRFTRVLVWLNLFLAVNGLLQVFTGTGFGNSEAMATRDGIRIMGTGIFNDPNDLGMTLVLAVPFVLSRLSAPGTRLPGRVGAFVILAALLAACYYTNSRGTILAIGVTFTVFAYRRAGALSATAVAAVGLVGILLLAPSRMSEMSADEASAQGRIQAWSEGLQMLKADPVFGVSFGGFADNHRMVAHNSFVHVLAELGLPGAVTFVGMFYWYFLGLGQARIQKTRADADRMRLRRDLGDSALGMLICMFFLSRQYTPVPSAILALGACYRSATPPGERRGGDNAFDTMLMHTAIVVALTFVMTVAIYAIAIVFADY